MRRPGGQYGGDSGGGGQSYGGGAAQMQQSNNKPGNYQGRHQEQQQQLPIGEKEERQQQPHHNQWQRWERDATHSKLPEPPAMSPASPFAEGQGREASRASSYYQNQRVDHRVATEKQGGGDPRPQSHEVDMEIGYEDDRAISFDGLEQRFLEDVMKLSKEQTDTEDAENARHRERINAINAQYEERLVALRAQHAIRRDDFLRRESQARLHQYHQIAVDQYPNSGMGPSEPRNDPRGYNAGPGPGSEPHRGYSSEYYPDSYRERERGRFPGNTRDHGYESKVPYPRGRTYDNSSRFY